MNQLGDLLRVLGARGVEFSISLNVSAPPGALSPEVVTELTRLKPALLVHLAGEPQRAALSSQRWGPALNDSEPGIFIDHPESGRIKAALDSADPADTYAVAERVAIQSGDA